MDLSAPFTLKGGTSQNCWKLLLKASMWLGFENILFFNEG